jgi:hypothetical protein
MTNVENREFEHFSLFNVGKSGLTRDTVYIIFQNFVAQVVSASAKYYEVKYLKKVTK